MQQICRHDWGMYKAKNEGAFKPFQQVIVENIPNQGSVSAHYLLFILISYFSLYRVPVNVVCSLAFMHIALLLRYPMIFD
jgi:hypothetical protein